MGSKKLLLRFSRARAGFKEISFKEHLFYPRRPPFVLALKSINDLLSVGDKTFHNRFHTFFCREIDSSSIYLLFCRGGGAQNELTVIQGGKTKKNTLHERMYKKPKNMPPQCSLFQKKSRYQQDISANVLTLLDQRRHWNFQARQPHNSVIFHTVPGIFLGLGGGRNDYITSVCMKTKRDGENTLDTESTTKRVTNFNSDLFIGRIGFAVWVL